MFSTLFSIVSWTYSIFWWSFWSTLVVSVLSFAVPLILQTFVHKKQDLKKKYNAEWALVTGGSSGIGRALVEVLAEQGLNVVIVALDDDLLKNFSKSISEQYPNQKFITLGEDLSKPEQSLENIKNATADLDIQLIFNNAGYITFGIFSDLPVQRHINNYHVNSTIPIYITHHFVEKMIKKGLKGCVTFTSSPAGQMPGPMASIYGGTKAFLTNFGSSLACELAPEGIDVLVMHPSPVNTNFYSNDSVNKSSSMAFFKKTATSPRTIAEDMFANIGQPGCVIRNQGYFGNFLQFMLKVVDLTVMTLIMRQFIPMNGEFKKLRSERSKNN